MLIALAFLPLAMLEVRTAFEQRQHVELDARDEALRMTRMVASSQQAMLSAARQLLLVLSQLDPLQRQEGEGAGASSFLRSLLKQQAIYANLGVADARGNVIRSALPLPPGTSIADRPYFQQAVATGGLAVGEYEVLAGKGVLSLAYPLRDPQGNVSGAVFVSLDLMEMSRVGAAVILHSGESLSLTSGQGVFLFRYPEPEKWMGREDRNHLINTTLGTGVGRFVGVDGVRRIYAVQRLELPEASLYVRAGVSEKADLASFALRLLRQFGLLTLIGAAALFLAWRLGSAFIVRPAHHLVGVARAVSAGNLQARSTLGAEAGELGELGDAFNQMTDALSRRITELAAAHEAVAQARDELEHRVEERTLELQCARERLVDAIENIDAGFVMFDADERLLTCNLRFREMWQRSGGLRRGMHFETLLREFVRHGGSVQGVDDMEAWLQKKLALFRKADGTPIEEQIAGRWIRVSYRRTRDGGTVSLRTDVTSLKQAQEALEHAAAELRRSNRELEQFAYVASHDLQEPLRMVGSYTQLLERRYADKLDQNARDFIRFAVDGAKRMQAFIRDLLLYSRVGTHGRPFERVETLAVLHSVLQNLRFASEEKQVAVTIEPLPPVVADPLELSQLFQNLIGNALKFSRSEVPLRVEVKARRNDTAWEFMVSDNGIGIAPQDLERIFVIFQRFATRHEQGTGIGLAICKKIVERHGGRIWVESQPGVGTTFHFTLPDRPIPVYAASEMQNGRGG